MTRRPPACRYPLALLVLIGLVVAMIIGPAGDTSASATASSINTSDRAQVAASFQTEVLDNLLVPHSWTGSTMSCTAGSSSAAYDRATLDTINWFRRMNGLPVVAESVTHSHAAQDTALMMHAAERLSHYPADSWPCHTESGAETAGLSNLTLGISGPRGVLGQIEDSGPSNEALGHRRWLLYPGLSTVGIGNTSWSGVVTVIGEFGDRPSQPNWISWPPEGYVPAGAVNPRWSVSYNTSATVDFGAATISVTENGRVVDVKKLSLHHGYGDATLAFEPIGISPDIGSDVSYEITVRDIEIDGRMVTRSWHTIAFDPSTAVQPAVPTEELPKCLGHPATIIGTEGADVIQGSSGRDVIVALGGNDVIDGRGGDDLICAGDGRDTVLGGDGSDRIIGGAGHDVLRGGSGADVINGQGGRDRLSGNRGNDRLIGGDQRDVIVGNSGRDSCWAAKPSRIPVQHEDRRSCEAGN